MRRCPVCDGTPREVLGAVRFAQIEGVSVHGGYDVVACRACGACFADGVPAQAAFDAYYAAASKYEREGASVAPHDVLRHRAEADEIASVLPRDAAILELGCATGALLEELSRRGFTRVRGIDPSPRCASVARERGLDVVAGSLFGSALGQSDAIILNAVLEHLVDVRAALARIRDALRPGGHAFIEVPDALSFERLRDAPYQQLSVEHINYFSLPGVENLARANGFEVARTWVNDRPHVGGGPDPALTFALRRVETIRGVEHEPHTRAALARYLARSAERDRALQAFVASLPDEPIVVWGCGTLCLRLLASSALSRANIVAFVDSNPRYHGHALRGVRIAPPTVLRGRREPILVMSVGHAAGIRRHITEELGYTQRVLTLPELP